MADSGVRRTDNLHTDHYSRPGCHLGTKALKTPAVGHTALTDPFGIRRLRQPNRGPSGYNLTKEHPKATGVILFTLSLVSSRLRSELTRKSDRFANCNKQFKQVSVIKPKK